MRKKKLSAAATSIIVAAITTFGVIAGALITVLVK